MRNLISRRGLIFGGLGAGASALMTACSGTSDVDVNTAPTIPPVPAGQPVRLTYWSWLKGLDRLAKLYRKFEPNVEIVPVSIPSGPSGGYVKLNSALAAGSGPDLAQIEFTMIPEYLMSRGLTDLRRYGADSYAPQIARPAWEQVSFLDGVYGAPQDTGPTGMFYRADLLSSVGASQPPASREEWRDVARQLKSRGIVMDTFPIGDASIFVMHASQAGARWFTPEEDGWTVNMTDAATEEVASFFTQSIAEGIVETGYSLYSPPWMAAAADGKIASVVDGSWADGLIKGVESSAGSWRVALPPRWSQGVTASVRGGSATAVMAPSRHPHEAAKFALWMSTNPEALDTLIEHSGIGFSPSLKHVGASREKGDPFFGGQNYTAEVFTKAAVDQNTSWRWWPVVQQSFTVLGDEIRKTGGSGSLIDAVRRSEEEIIRVFRRKGLKIRKVS